MSDPMLVLKGITKTFPGQTALRGVDLTLERGEIHALLGQNGSGKSTLIKILAGFHRPDPGGLASFNGVPLALDSPSSAREAGIRFIHQDLALIPELNAVDNLALGTRYVGKYWISERKERQAARNLLDGLGINIDLEVPVGQLEAAQRTMLVVARALRDGLDSCRLLVLDEPTVSLAASEVGQLFDLLRRLRTDGRTVLYVTHRLDEVFEIADSLTVFRDGSRVTTRPVAGIDHHELVEVIVGRPIGDVYPELPPVQHDVAFRVSSVKGQVVDDVSFDVRAGEILGITGLIGSGREELPYLLFGARPWQSGTIDISGRKFSEISPSVAISAGVGFVSSDRKNESSLGLFSVRENVTLPSIPIKGGTRWLSHQHERAAVIPWLAQMNVQPADPERLLATLSGGNQQKAVVARWLRLSPKVLIVDEPTQGVDVGAKAQLYSSVADMAARGSAVVVFSSDSEELAAICDRVLIMRSGQIRDSIGGPSLSAASIDHLILKKEQLAMEEIVA